MNKFLNEGDAPSNEEGQQITVVKGMDLINLVRKEPKPKFLWHCIPEGSTGLITGVAKTGKTTFAENLAFSLAIGRKQFYGEPMDGNPRKVLFVNLEESYRLRSWRNEKQIQRLNPKELELFSENYLSTPIDFPEYLNNEEDWVTLRDYINASEAEVVFIDSLGHMFIGEIEKSSVAQGQIQTFRQYIGSLNKTVIVVHHMTKGNERPIDQDSIAGSRFISQEFQYAYGFANIPTKQGGNYSCMLYNKHVPKNDNEATLYSITNDGWVEHLGKDNKYDLYETKKVDGRHKPKNKEVIYEYVIGQASQGSQNITTKALMDKFVSTDTMSKDTLYKKVNLLIEDGVIDRDADQDGIYVINSGLIDGTRLQ